MKIIFVTNRLGGGGAERVLVHLVNRFSKKKYQVKIICLKEGVQYSINDDVDIFYLNREKNKFQRMIKIRNIIKQEAPKCVICFEYFVNMQTILACFGLKNRIIISERNDPKRQGGGFPKNSIRNFLYRFCDVLVCQTPDAKAYFPKYIQKKTVVIPNPIKDDLPLPWQGERERRIVNFCRLEQQKNLQLLIDAFKEFHSEYNDYCLEIYGDGSERESLQQYIDDLGLSDSVTLFHFVTDIHQRVLKAAMFVSSSDYEGMSNSMLEAMAIGLPVICTDCPCGGARMMITNEENGLLVPCGNVELMANAMKRIAEDRTFANHMSAESTQIIEKLSITNIFQIWEKEIS